MEEAKAGKVEQIFSKYTLEEVINKLAGWATQNHYNFALYRKPRQNPIILIDSEKLKQVTTEIEVLESGFLWANYDGTVYHIQSNLQVDLGNRSIFGDNSLVPYESELPDSWQYYVHGQAQESTSKEAYIHEVQTGINHIVNSKLTKVVPSKVKLHLLAKDFSLADAFVKLCKEYPSAFVSIVSTKEHGTWLTATPEMLIDVNTEGIFKTMALAGTQKHEEGKSLHEVAWTDKEIEEQAMVSRYIINRLKEIRLREFIEEGPMTVRAANLTHLCSTFTVDTQTTNFPNLGGVMLNLLHPTSAVCGMPKEPAVELIKEIEGHDRKFYTGYLGPVNVNGETSVYVNLRCMELFEGKSNLFAGAGVTAFSNPEKEWEETELKCNTLLNVIK